MSSLQGIRSYPAFSMKGSLPAQTLKLEEHFNQYERFCGKIGEDMKAAVLPKSTTGQLNAHLNMTLNEGRSYTKIRETILAYDAATTGCNEATSLSYMSASGGASGVAPMEIARVQKGKGKDGRGKGKGKDGKGKQKGHGKGKSKNKDSWRESWKREDGKGYGGKQNNKGGQKGKDSKGKSKEDQTCHVDVLDSSLVIVGGMCDKLLRECSFFFDGNSEWRRYCGQSAVVNQQSNGSFKCFTSWAFCPGANSFRPEASAGI